MSLTKTKLKETNKMVKTTDKKQELQKFLKELLTLMDVDARVDASDGEDGAIKLSISSEDSALLIGYHGKTIGALGTILGVISYERYGEKVPVLIDVDGWRERREETVIGIAHQAAEHVKATGESAPIHNLTPYERRVVHMALAEDPDVITESEGEGRDRYLVVKPKS